MSNWIKKAVNPKHKGYCTPMTKSTCTPRRKALARTFKKHHGFHQDGGATIDNTAVKKPIVQPLGINVLPKYKDDEQTLNLKKFSGYPQYIDTMGYLNNIQMLMMHGNPNLNEIPIGKRSNFDSNTNTINITPSLDAFYGELAHAEQLKAMGSKKMNAKLNTDYANNAYQNSQYTNPQTLEYNAHTVLQPQLRQQAMNLWMNSNHKEYGINYEFKSGGFKLNPNHAGWCTPMSKSTCTGKRRQFAINAKNHFKKQAEGGSINNTGYLEGADTVDNDFNIIPSNHITTQGMAFPIVANGQILHPNTGDYMFNTSHVMEYPLRGQRSKKNRMQAGGNLKFPDTIQNQAYMRDLMTAALQSGKPLNELPQETGVRSSLLANAQMLYGQPIAQKLYSSINIFNQDPGSLQLSPDARATRYFDTLGNDPDIQSIRQSMKSFGSGIQSNINNTPVQQIQQMSAAPIAKRRRGGRMQIGGQFTPSGSKVDASTWAMDSNTNIQAPVGNTQNYTYDPTQTTATFQGQQTQTSPVQGRGNISPLGALSSTLLPLNVILGKLAETNEWKQNENYRLNQNNPLSTLGYNDGQSDGVKYGYSSYMRGGRTCKTGYCMGGSTGKKYQDGGDTFEPDEFDQLDDQGTHEAEQVPDNQQLLENNDLSDEAEYQMALKAASESSNTYNSIMSEPSQQFDYNLNQDDGDTNFTLRPSSSSPLRGSNNSENAFNYLLSKGLPDHAAAGIVGNLSVESNGVDPRSFNPNDLGKPSYGIAQWRGPRLTALKNYAASSGKDVGDLHTQLDYLLQEAGQRGDLKHLMNTSSAEEAAYVFGKKFERPADASANWQKRQKIARGLIK